MAKNIRQLQSSGTIVACRPDGVRPGEGELLLLDWRGEETRPFYTAIMFSPLGPRHPCLGDHEVLDVNDELPDGSILIAEGIVGDGPLITVLGDARAGQMRETGATLQTE